MSQHDWKINNGIASFEAGLSEATSVIEEEYGFIGGLPAEHETEGILHMRDQHDLNGRPEATGPCRVSLAENVINQRRLELQTVWCQAMASRAKLFISASERGCDVISKHVSLVASLYVLHRGPGDPCVVHRVHRGPGDPCVVHRVEVDP